MNVVHTRPTSGYPSQERRDLRRPLGILEFSIHWLINNEVFFRKIWKFLEMKRALGLSLVLGLLIGF